MKDLLENRKSSLTAWTIIFTSDFLKTFTIVMRRERAELLLQTRTQRLNEGVIVFIEEMKRLFRRADAEMMEKQKLQFLMRGAKQELFLFACMIRNPSKTVSISHLKRP